MTRLAPAHILGKQYILYVQRLTVFTLKQNHAGSRPWIFQRYFITWTPRPWISLPKS